MPFTHTHARVARPHVLVRGAGAGTESVRLEAHRINQFQHVLFSCSAVAPRVSGHRTAAPLAVPHQWRPLQTKSTLAKILRNRPECRLCLLLLIKPRMFVFSSATTIHNYASVHVCSLKQPGFFVLEFPFNESPQFLHDLRA